MRGLMAAAAGCLVLALAGCLGSQNDPVDTSGISKVTLKLTMGSAVSGKPSPSPSEGEGGVMVGKVSRAPIAGVKIIVTVTGPDLASQLTFRFENATIDTTSVTTLSLQVPAGATRTFAISVYASNGTLLLEATTTTSTAGGAVTVTLPLLPAPVPGTVSNASSGPPAVQVGLVSQTPPDRAWCGSTCLPVTAVFNRSLNAVPVAGTTFILKDSQGTSVAGDVAYNAVTSTATFTPSALPLTADRTFTALISATIADTDGRTLGRSIAWSFRTGEFALASLASVVNVSATPRCSTCHRAAIGPDGRIHVVWANETRQQGIPGLGTLFYKNAGSWLQSFLPDPPRLIATSADDGKQPDIAVGTGAVPPVTIVYRDEGVAGSGAGLPAGAANVNALVLDVSQPLPAQPMVYAGTNAGIIKSTDGGKRWEAKSTNLPVDVNGVPVAVFALAPPRPTPSSTLYAGTELGVFRSADQGETWSARTAGLPAVSVRALLVHPTLSSILYAGTTTAGVFRSVDAGLTWLPVNTGLTDPIVRALAFDPTNPAVLYAGTAKVGGVFRSLDQGNHWTQVGSPATGLTEPHVYALVVDPVEPQVLYAGTDQGVFRSVDGGAGWTVRSHGMRGPVGLFPGVLTLALDPSAHTTVFSGGGCCSDGVYRTADRGGQWKPSNHGLSPAHIGALAIDPRLPSVVYAGATASAAGIYVSVDGGDTWKVTFGKNLEIFTTRSADNGATFSTPANLSQTAGYSDTPRVATDSSNRVHVIWRDDTSGNAEVAYSRAIDGTTFPPYTNLSTTPGLSMQPSLAVQGSTVAVVWQEDGEDIWLARSTNGGDAFAPRVRVAETPGPSDSPKVAIDGSGTLHVVWRDESFGNSEILYARSINGVDFSTPKNLSDSPGFSALPDLAVSGSGASAGVYAAWRDMTPTRDAEVFSAESTDGGANFSLPANRSGTPFYSTEPQLLVDPGSPANVYLSWREDVGETAAGTGDLEIVMGKLK